MFGKPMRWLRKFLIKVNIGGFFMKPDITKRLDDILKPYLLVIPRKVRLDIASFDKKEIKYLNKKAKDKDITIEWYNSEEE